MGVHWLLPIYDPLTRLLGLRAAHHDLADQASLQPGQRALEIGCGTGNLALVLKRRQPHAEVVGLDPDPRALERARRKAARAGLRLAFDHGFAEELPYPDGAFDHVLSAFMFHHLEPASRRRMLEEAKRVLRPGGSLHLLDFGGRVEPSDGLMARLSARSPRLRDNLGDAIPRLMGESGFLDPVEAGYQVGRVGRYTRYRATA
jgi:ubiquinone/menaquinone biosynthesis C-methylase UbiE